MKKQDSWSSEFRKNKFYERQNNKKEKQHLEICNENSAFKFSKTIAVLLDLDGTSDFMDDQKAAMFVKQLEFLRKKFGADSATISISTHYQDPNRMLEVLDILSRHLLVNVKIGVNFYYGGTYDYEKKVATPCVPNFNVNKVKTFDEYYVHAFGLKNQWFAIIDDGVAEDVYKKYQNNHPMFVCRPSQSEQNLSTNCFMCISTTTKGFDGVIEGMNTYIDSIRKLSKEQILESQRNMMTHLSGFELTAKIRKREYAFVEKYFSEGYADIDDYRDVLNWLTLTVFDQVPTKEELVLLKNVLELMDQRFRVNSDEPNIEKVKKLQESFQNNNI